MDSADRTRVLLLLRGLNTGGAEKLATEQALNSSATFEYVVAVTSRDETPLTRALAAAGIRVHHLAGDFCDVRWIRALVRLLREGNISLVHVHSPSLLLTTRLLIRLTDDNIRIVATYHSMWGNRPHLFRLSERLCYKANHATIAVSAQVLRSLPTSLQKHTQVIHHGIDTHAVRQGAKSRDSARAELRIPADGFVIGAVANLRPEKSLDALIEAAHRTPDRCADGRPLLFIIVGGGPLRRELRELVRMRGLESRVLLAGPVDDGARAMSAFDVFTLTSTIEGLPVALMEAFSIGLPVVVTRAGGLSDVVHEGGNGTLVDIGDIDALANAYTKLANDTPFRARLALGSARSASSFDRRRAGAAIEDVYFASLPHANSTEARASSSPKGIGPRLRRAVARR
jgi:glycosyltransferase involved in cell wall biosynthesis